MKQVCLIIKEVIQVDDDGWLLIDFEEVGRRWIPREHVDKFGKKHVASQWGNRCYLTQYVYDRWVFKRKPPKQGNLFES